MPPRPVCKYQAEAAASDKRCSLTHLLTASRHNRLGICFSGAGFGAAYQLGAAHVLQTLGILSADTPVSGASAGSIVAVASRCSLRQLDVLNALNAVAQDVLHHGEKKRLGGVLRREMEQLLPPDAHQLCSSGPRVNASSSSAAHCHIIPPTSAEPQQQASSSAIAQRASSTAQHNSAVANTAAPDLNQQPPCVLGATRVTCPSCLQPDVFVGGYASNAELLDALLAGANIPRTSSARLTARFRGHRYVDAGIRDPCPPIPDVDITLIVYPVPHQLLRRPWPYRLLLKPPLPAAVAISPGQHYGHWPYSRSYSKSNSLVMRPQPTEVLHMLFERGRRDALAWAQHIGLTADHVRQLGGRCSSDTDRSGVTAAPLAEGCGEPQAASESELSAPELLSLPPEQLPMLVSVPRQLRHFLS